MPDSPDLTPPPEEPLAPERKALIRQRLAAAAMREPELRRQRWLAPGLAAAAVLAVVAGAFVVASTNNGSDGGDNSLQPAAPSTRTPAPSTPTTSRSKVLPPNPDAPSASLPAECKVFEGMPLAKRQCSVFTSDRVASCDEEVAELHEPSLKDAAPTSKRDAGRGSTYLYETKQAWVVCDDTTAVPGGPQSEQGFTPTLVSFHLKSTTYQPDTQTLAMSENLIANPDDYNSIQYGYFFAAGRDFDGVQAISYDFPDGHREDAVVGQNGLWSMSYVVTDGILIDPNTNVTTLDPIEATVNYTGGDVRTFTLQWGLDTCAQINHGC